MKIRKILIYLHERTRCSGAPIPYVKAIKEFFFNIKKFNTKITFRIFCYQLKCRSHNLIGQILYSTDLRFNFLKNLKNNYFKLRKQTTQKQKINLENSPQKTNEKHYEGQNYEKWKELLKIRFGDWIDDKGNIILKVLSSKGNSEYEFYSIKELCNPKYSIFEMIKRILKMYDDYCGGSALASKQSNHYDNLLFCLACVCDNVEEETLEEWRKRFYHKFGIT